MSMEPVTIGHGRYEMSSLLGRGGMAEVRKGRDLRLGRTVAVKRLRADLARDPTFQARFRREAQSAASLNNPSIVAVYDTGQEEATDGSGVVLPYIVMEYVEGRTLRDILREGRKILPERALEIVASVLGALDYSHRAGIIHRDIKPANVMLTPSGDVKVMDFGIARAVADSSATMTQTAAVVGTAQYLSPEQARGEQVDARSDLYSAGCLLYELLAGRPPFVGDSPVSVAYQHVREEPSAPSTYDSSIPPAIDAIAMKALTKRVDERYQSATEMRADIERALSGQHVLAPSVAGAAAMETQPFLPPAPIGSTSTTAVTHAADYEEEQQGQRRWVWVLMALLIALIIAALLVVPRLLSNEPTPQSQVPNLVGDTVSQAQTKLDDAGLKLGGRQVDNSSTVPRGHIIRQSEPAGSRVDEGAEVNVVVSAGERTAVVRDVTAMNLDAATRVLEDELGFNVVAREDAESTERRFEVTRTDPTAGSTRPVGSDIVVYYSAGYRVVPSVVGKTQGQATAILEKAGFNVVPSSVASDAAKGTVTRQSPSALTRQPFQSFITISVSLGPLTTTPTSPTASTTPPETTPPETTTPATTTPPTETTPATTTPTGQAP